MSLWGHFYKFGGLLVTQVVFSFIFSKLFSPEGT